MLFSQNTTSRPRDRVRGAGPNRNLLPNWQVIDRLPQDVIDDIMSIFRQQIGYNDFAEPGRNYMISQHCPLLQKIPQDFQHILLMRLREGGDPRNEKDYSAWVDFAKNGAFFKYMTSKFPQAFRLRISVLHPQRYFSWHIDTNTSVACRCSIALNNEEAVFEVKRRQQIERVPMKSGEVVFTNTGWPHQVYNPSNWPRVNLVFGIEYQHMADRLPLLSGK